jgi:predicted amidohydrolase YtcJ
MLEPYVGQPDNYGIRVTDYEEMHELTQLASRAGLPTAIHAIGDRAVREVLNIFEAVRQDEAQRGIAPSALPHRVEHVQLIHPDDLDRFRQLNLIASMQPIHATSDYEAADALWGERALYAYNAREQLRRGVTVAFGSDAPIEPFNPWTGIFAAVTRRRPNGLPTREGWYPQLTFDGGRSHTRIHDRRGASSGFTRSARQTLYKLLCRSHGARP